MKTVLITGCSSGIGLRTAVRFARKHWWVVATMRDLESEGGQELARVTKKEHLEIDLFELDIDSQKSVEKSVKEILEKHPIIDVLVNNAGLGYFGPVEEFSIKEMKAQFETNVFGTMRMFKEMVPIMRQRHKGMIINISSIVGLISTPLYGVYSASKYAMEALSEAAAAELRPFGVKVVLVEPGSFATKFSTNLKLPEGLASINESPYFGLMEKFVKRNKKTVKNKLFRYSGGGDRVAKLIFKIANRDNPSLRNVIGIDAKSYLVVKKILGQKLWTKLLSRVYKW